MKFGRLYLLLVLFVLSSWNSVFAQSVTFSDIRLEHNVPDNNGRNMLQFHYSVTVTGCQGHDVRIYMWVDIPQGVTHYYADGNKMISQSDILHCPWETTNFQNGWIGIYNDQLNPKPGKNTYYTRLGAWDETLGKYIGWSDFLSFENTGSEKSVASSGGSSSKATLNNSYVVHQSQRGMTFHLDLSVSGKKDQNVWCIIEMWYYSGKDKYYLTRSKGDFEWNGHLAVYKKLTPSYENSIWDDLQLLLPYSEITATVGNQNWGRTLHYCVKVVDTEGTVLLKEWIDTPGIAYSQNGICGYCKGSGKCFICNGTGWIITSSCNLCFGRGRCTYCGGTGGHLSHYSYNEGDQIANPYNSQPIINQPLPDPVSRTIECSSCHGSGKCSWCAGRGERRNQYTGTLKDCDICHGRGICTSCNGRGWCYF